MQRKSWLDALRAMAMLYVVFGHQAQWCEAFFLFTTPIKIPLFFAISGYLFNYYNGQQVLFFKNCFFKLVFPFFFLVTIPAFFFVPAPRIRRASAGSVPRIRKESAVRSYARDIEKPLACRQSSTSWGPSAWKTMIGLPVSRLKDRYR